MTWRRASRCNSQACVEVAFRKAAASAGNGACVEVGFHKSSYSADTANCVEVGTCTCHGVLVRDSKDPTGPVLSFSADSFAAFLADLKAGVLDHTG